MNWLRHHLAILGIMFGMYVATTALAQSNVTVTEGARKHFRAGVAYIDDPTGPKYEEAYREFHKAYADSPTYKILTNIGLCALNLERDGEAIDAYQRFLADAKPDDIPQDKRKLMERDIAMLKASLVSLTISSQPQKLVLQDERLTSKGGSVVNRYEITDGTLSLGIHPGHHRITASAEGYQSQSWVFEADSATTHSHDFKLEVVSNPVSKVAQSTTTISTPRDVQPRKPIPTLVYVGAAATGVFTIGAAVTAVIANSKKDEFENVNTGDDPDKAKELRESGKTFALITDIGIGAAVLSAVGTIVIYATTPTTKPDTKTPVARVKVSPSVGPSSAGVSVFGQF